MGVPRRRPRELTPNERVRERMVDDRVRRGRFEPRSKEWTVKAARLARDRGVDVDDVLDTFDERASMHEWNGYVRAEAEARAWNETVELLCPAT
jgi:hypothetical protein